MGDMEIIMRWIHYIAGVMWIGHLWFFNFVNANLQKDLQAETKKIVNPPLMLRALFVFRWGAMFTFLSGLYMLNKYYNFPMDGTLFSGADKTNFMAVGALFGTLMWFNVWFVIWPAQKKIIGALQGGPAPDPKLAPRATLASKINTYLSVPLLLDMMVGAHGTAPFGGGVTGLVIATVVGLALVYLGYMLAPKISTQMVKAG